MLFKAPRLYIFGHYHFTFLKFAHFLRKNMQILGENLQKEEIKWINADAGTVAAS